jgi:hypothetical protein
MFIQDSCLFMVGFRQVYTGFWFIHGWVYACLYRILVYLWLGLDMFIQDSGLFMVGFIQDSCLFMVEFRQVYTGFLFIYG